MDESVQDSDAVHPGVLGDKARQGASQTSNLILILLPSRGFAESVLAVDCLCLHACTDVWLECLRRAEVYRVPQQILQVEL